MTLVLGACTSTSAGSGTSAEQDAAVATSPSPSTSAVGTATDLVVTIDTEQSDACFDGPTSDLAWFDAEWKSLGDLDSFGFDLIDANGVKLVGTPYTVPPVNFGGRIDIGGSSTWRGWRTAVGDTFVDIDRADRVDSWVPIKDQTGLLVFHLRFDQATLASTGASFGGVRATYRTDDGETHTVESASKQSFGVQDDC